MENHSFGSEFNTCTIHYFSRMWSANQSLCGKFAKHAIQNEARTKLRRALLRLVSWCFEPSQPQRITSGLSRYLRGTRRITHSVVNLTRASHITSAECSLLCTPYRMKSASRLLCSEFTIYAKQNEICQSFAM